MFASHFSVQNIPFGIASIRGLPHRSTATRIKDTVIFIDELANHGLLSSLPEEALCALSQVQFPPNLWMHNTIILVLEAFTYYVRSPY